ncbi:MAG: menaquinone biosynthesis protein [Pyrinomonadaceae bacterium]|nr:menaquinone biosynthesis protein [Pyrinomonadaceae bacterium]
MRISASSYSNTAPLIWSFLYGSRHGSAEVILDNAPSRSAALLAGRRVDAALVPVIAYQTIPDLFVVPDVCVGAREKVRSVCLVTKGNDLSQIGSVALDTSSRTSVALTKIIFREFFAGDPEWIDHEPDVDSMLESADCALLIGDPALTLDQEYRKFDLVEIWKRYTDFGFVFAMWMTGNRELEIDFNGARDEGLTHLDAIIANYSDEISLADDEMREYLTENISFRPDESMKEGLKLYFSLAKKHGLIEEARPIRFVQS